MKQKMKIKFLNDKTDVLMLNMRDQELVRIMNRMHSYTYRNKRKYTRKIKHKKDEV